VKRLLEPAQDSTVFAPAIGKESKLMRGRAKNLLSVLIVGALLVPVLTGCSSQAPQLTKQEQTEFKGGPMPESARRIVQQKLQEAQQRAPQNPASSAGPQ
jgi:hypothetical protein